VLVLLCFVAGVGAACSKDRGESADRGRPVDWDGPDVVRVALPPDVRTGERYVEAGKKIAKGVCVFGRTAQSGKAGTARRDWLLAYEGRSCRALMARAATP
jgi:hypothetical protein